MWQVRSWNILGLHVRGRLWTEKTKECHLRLFWAHTEQKNIKSSENCKLETKCYGFDGVTRKQMQDCRVAENDIKYRAKKYTGLPKASSIRHFHPCNTCMLDFKCGIYLQNLHVPGYAPPGKNSAKLNHSTDCWARLLGLSWKSAHGSTFILVWIVSQ